MQQNNNEENVMPEEQPQNPEEVINPFENLTPEEFWQMQQQNPQMIQQQYPQMMPQQNAAAQMVSTLTSLLAAFMPMAMMGSMASGMFLQKDWLPPAERSRLETLYGHWAVERAQAMIPPVAGVTAVEAAAKHMLEQYKATIGVSAAAPPPKTRIPKARAAGLTSEETEILIADVKEFHEPSGTWPGTEDIKEWARDRFNKAIATPAARTVLDKAKRVI